MGINIEQESIILRPVALSLRGVSLRPADEFPVDDSGYGFDNIGDVLSLSPMLMEKYISTARTVARDAVFPA